jgi:hypothetical protein
MSHISVGADNINRFAPVKEMIFQNFSHNIYTLMMRELTLNALVKSLYKEGSRADRRMFQAAAAADPVLRDEMQDVRLAWQHLPRVRFRPPQRSLRNILKYSRETPVQAPC